MNIMKIQTHIYSSKYSHDNNQYFGTRKNDFNNSNIDTYSFTGNSNDYKETIKKLDKRLQKELLRLKTTEETSSRQTVSITERMRLKEDVIEEMSNLTDEYRAINAILSSCNPKNISNSADIAVDFLEAMKRLGLDKGFNRISGYKDVKKFLKSKFIFSAILKDKIAENVNVPNTLFFYGPTNTGKSTFAIALAEQSLSVPRVVDISKFQTKQGITDKVGIMDLIEDYGRLSKEHFNTTQQRSIIIINEAEKFLSNNPDIITRFTNFIKDCAQKYKCTVFLTTNFPRRIDPNILSSSTTPFKISINPMEKEDCYELIKNRINMSKKHLTDNEIYALINRLYRNPNERYSNGAITYLFNLVWKKNPDATLQDYLNILDSDNGEIEPDITAKELNDYKELKEQFAQDTL